MALGEDELYDPVICKRIASGMQSVFELPFVFDNQSDAMPAFCIFLLERMLVRVGEPNARQYLSGTLLLLKNIRLRVESGDASVFSPEQHR